MLLFTDASVCIDVKFTDVSGRTDVFVCNDISVFTDINVYRFL